MINLHTRIVFFAVAFILLCENFAAADLIEVTAHGDVTSVLGFGLRTSIRPGVPTSFTYAYHDSIIDRGTYISNNHTRYQLTEPIVWRAGDYEVTTNGWFEIFSNAYRVHGDRTDVPGEVATNGRQAEAIPQMWLVAAERFDDVTQLPLPVSERFKLSDTHPQEISVSFHPQGSVVISAVTSITERRYQPGDANRDGPFNQLDVVGVLSADTYLTDEPALWADGDFTGDGLFNQLDIIAALPNYGVGLNAAMPVPEPSAIVLLTLGLLGLVACGRRRVASV